MKKCVIRDVCHSFASFNASQALMNVQEDYVSEITDTVWIFLLSGTGTTTPTTTPKRIPLDLLLEFTPKCTAP